MIKTPIPQLLDKVGIKHTCEEGRGRSECPLHGGENPKHFSFSEKMARCSCCGWVGDSTDLAKALELFSPGEIYQEDEITSTLAVALPNNPRVLEIDNLLSLARTEIVQVMRALEELEGHLEMKEALFQVECETRWSEYLDYVDHLHARRKVIVAGGDKNEN